ATLADTDDVAIPAVAVAEYLAGTLLDPDPGRPAAQRAFLDEVLDVVPVHAYDRAVADHHDLIIAATARATDRAVVTTDERARFGELPEVTARLINS
ncbi:MAG: hypothetical protein ACRDQ5_01390, partial [Sciscionella sp.]